MARLDTLSVNLEILVLVFCHHHGLDTDIFPMQFWMLLREDTHLSVT